MEKPLEETTIEIPTKALSIAEPETEPSAPELTLTEDVAPPRHAESLSHLLPANTFAQISPRSYLFPGAEVTLDNMEGDSEESDDDFSEDDEDDENEGALNNASEIVVPDIDNVLSNEVPVPEISPTPTTSGSLSPTPSSSQLQCYDHEAVENITDIQADDAKDDLEPAPVKRPRLEKDEGEKLF